FASHHASPIALVVNRSAADALEDIRAAVTAKIGQEVLVAAVPENPVIMAPTVAAIQEAVEGTLVQGSTDWLGRVSLGTVVAAMSLPNVLRRLSENCTVVAPGDRYDLLPGLFMAQQS